MGVGLNIVMTLNNGAKFGIGFTTIVIVVSGLCVAGCPAHNDNDNDKVNKINILLIFMLGSFPGGVDAVVFHETGGIMKK